MSRIINTDNFLINGEYVFRKLKIRSVFYSTIIVIVFTLFSIFSSWFSVNFIFEGHISEAYTKSSSDTTSQGRYKVIEIQYNKTLYELFEKRQNIEVELSDSNFLLFRSKGEIIQTSLLKNNSQGNLYKAVIAKAVNEGQIEFFSSDLPGHYKAVIKIQNVKISLNDLLNFILLKDLCSIEINHFT